MEFKIGDHSKCCREAASVETEQAEKTLKNGDMFFLKAENARLRKALEYLVNEWIEDHEDETIEEHSTSYPFGCGVCIARQALSGKSE